MAQVRGTFPALYDNVDKDIIALVGDTLSELPAVWRDIYRIKSSKRKFERVVSMASFTSVPEKSEGADYSLGQFTQGYTKDFTHLEFGLSFEVSETAEEDDQQDVIASYAVGMARAARYAEEQYAARPFNNGFTSETTPDGQYVFDTDHVLVGGGTARNKLSTAADLSVTSLTQALIDVQTETKSEEGFYVMPTKGYKLYVPPALEFLADRIVNSTGLPGSAENDRNPLKARRKIEVVVNPHLSDADAWFLVDAGKDHGFLSYTRVGIGMKPPVRMPRSDNRLYKVRFRRSWGVDRWQGAFASEGA
jgi:hypothetical protein